jgi:acetoin utilization protein AcuB
MREKIQLPVEEFTSENPVTANETTTIREARDLMKEANCRHLPVVKDGKPVGLISDRDLRLFLSHKDALDLDVSFVMADIPFIVNKREPMEKVALEMSRKKIGSAIVTDADDKVFGIFTSTDALNAVVELIRGDWD